MALIVRFVVVVLVGTDKGLVSCLVENGILAGGRTMPLAGVARDKVAAPDDRAITAVEARVLCREVDVDMAPTLARPL